MAERVNWKDLLVADLAVAEGLASAADLAPLLARRWSDGPALGRSFLEQLATSCRLAPQDVERLSTAAERILRNASGAAVASDGGPAASSSLRPISAARYGAWSPVGEGGMGTVYRAHDAELDRPVAVKVMRVDARRGATAGTDVAERALARFLREARLTGRLEHPGIVPVHEVGRTAEGHPYYTMRLVKGARTLADAITEAFSLPERLALLEPFLKVCDTVAYAHANGVVHRDLKPLNVALGAYGEVIVLDWGLAKAIGDPSDARAADLEDAAAQAPADFQTGTGILGTVGYLAPEGLVGAADAATPTADVFSLGVVLYEILTGERPWFAPDLVRYAFALRDDAEDAAVRRPEVPVELSNIARKALAREPSARYADAGALATAIRAWQASSAAAREAEARRREAEQAVVGAEGAAGAVRGLEADRAAAALALLEKVTPDDPALAALRARIERVRGVAAAERTVAERRRVVRKAVLVAGALLALAATVFVVVLGERNASLSTALANESAARRREVVVRARADTLSTDLLTEMRDALWPVGRIDLLAKAADLARRHHASVADDAPPDDRRRASTALENTARVYEAQGRVDEALAVFRDVVRMRRGLLAQRVREARVPSSLEVTQARDDLAVALTGLADQLLARGTLAEAQAAQEESLALGRENLPIVSDPMARRRVMRAEDRLAVIGIRRRDFPYARAHHAASLEMAEALLGAAPNDRTSRRELVSLLLRTEELATETRSPDGVAAALERAIATLDGLLKDDPTDREQAFLRTEALLRRATFRSARGDVAGALADLDAHEAGIEELVAFDPSNVVWKRASGLGVLRRIEIDRKHDRWADTEPLTTRLIERWTPLAERPGAPSPAFVDLALAYKERARTMRFLGRWPDARTAWSRVVEARRRALTGLRDHDLRRARRELAEDLFNLAGAIADRFDDPEAAVAAFRESIQTLDALHAEDATIQGPLDAGRAQLGAAEVDAGRTGPVTPAENEVLARWMMRRGHDVRAADAYVGMLAEPKYRDDLGHRYRFLAACFAMRAIAAGAPDVASRRATALALLEEDVRARRSRIEAATRAKAVATDDATRQALAQEIAGHTDVLEEIRAKNADLAPLRGEPAFLALFPTTEPSK